MKEEIALKQIILREIAKCRTCRFCVDVCPTYQVSNGVETFSAYGRLQTLKYLITGMLSLDDALVYSLYSCLECKRCERVCKSKGQDIEICKIMEMGRNLITEKLAY